MPADDEFDQPGWDDHMSQPEALRATDPAELTVTIATQGDGQAVADLGALALSKGTTPHVPFASLAEAIDNHGGRLRLPYGHGHCLTARIGTNVVGMLYAVPPIRWLEAQPATQRTHLTQALIEIELLAVSEPHRNHGAGTALLRAAEQFARRAGTQLALAKIEAGAFPTMRWYRRRGYTIAAQGEPVLFRTRFGFNSCDDGSDGYQLAVKTLQPSATVRRRAKGADSCLVVEQATQPAASEVSMTPPGLPAPSADIHAATETTSSSQGREP
ncbi:GNAT family N-acetyltransferase [Streptomyces roseochromogenus]|uniref:GNAT family N-acetyltransferase n=1 Tax=Streptomyces roseochromogenus TaxID=285450 RepID=UPI00131A0D0E|nr:GNAT family N-acetyltransferase [Streptomyces roseochromogenus]